MALAAAAEQYLVLGRLRVSQFGRLMISATTISSVYCGE
jgi:hypothetical protein